MTVPRDVALGVSVGVFLSAVAALGGGFGAQVGGSDLFAMYLSKHRYVADAFAQGRFPLWNPYEYAGVPLHGLSQGSVLYLPVALAHMVAEPLPALQILYYVHIVAYSLLVVLYLSRAGIGAPGCALAALVAVGCFFNALALVGNDHPHTLFPLPFLVGSLIAWEAWLRGRRIALPVFALLIAIQWLPGYPELAMDATVILPLVALLTPGRPVQTRTAVAIALVVLGAMLAAAHLLPLAEATWQSARLDKAELFAARRSLFAMPGADALVGDLLKRYGAAALFLFALGLLRRHRARPAWAAALAFCLFATNRPFSLLYELPGFAMQQHAWGWDVIEPLFVGFFAASGVEWLRRSREGARGLVAPGLAAALAATAFSRGALHEAAVALLCALCAAPPLRSRFASPLVVTALVALHVGGVMYQIGTTGLRAAPELDSLEPRAELLRTVRENRSERPRIASPVELFAGQLLPKHLPSPAGYEPAIPPRRIYRLNRELGLDLRQMHYGWPRAAAVALKEHPGAGKAIGLGLVVVPPGRERAFAAAGFELALHLPDGDAVLYREAAPRFQILHAVRTAPDARESLRMLLAPDFDPTRDVILEDPGVEIALAPPPDGAVELCWIRWEEPERIQLRVDAASPGVLVIADTWYPGWQATVDGAPTPILRANYAFRAVAIPAGRSEVVLRYRPLSFTIGCAVSGLGVLVLVALLVWAGRAPTRAPDPEI